MGPCRIDPFGEGPQVGVCGADADIIVARNLGRMIAAGRPLTPTTAATWWRRWPKSPRARRRATASRIRPSCAACPPSTGSPSTARTTWPSPANWPTPCRKITASRKACVQLVERARRSGGRSGESSGITPRGIDRETSEMMHRTHMGVDNDWVTLLLHGMRNALSDGWGGSMIATEVSDILFGSACPRPAWSTRGAQGRSGQHRRARP